MEWLAAFLQPILCWLAAFWCKLSDVLIGLLVDVLALGASLLAVIPIPDAVAGWQWPDAGPLAGSMIEAGIPQALAIIAGAYTVRFCKGLIPFIRA